MEYKGFIGGSNPAQGWTLDAQFTMNWYPERSESQGSTARMALYPTPGVESLDEADTGPGRGHFFMDGREFAVIGRTLWEIDSIGQVTNRGNLTLSGLPCTINSNGDGGGQLLITSGGNGWLFDLTTNTLSSIGTISGKADLGAHLDGYFLALDQDTSTFYVSDLLDGSTWDTGTMFAQRSAAPDPWLSLAVLGRYVWLLGEQTSEVWYNSGGAFPFELHPSGLVPYGIAAPFSVAVGDAALYWLGASKTGEAMVMRSTGFTPEVISKPPIELRIGEYTRIDDAVGECYTADGHTFYVLTFPTAQVTWVYDARTGLWHNRGTWLIDNAEFTFWRPRWIVKAFGEHRALDAEGRQVYRLARDIGTDVEDRPIKRVRRAPALQSENQRIFYSSFELDLEPGLGLTGDQDDVQGADPQMFLRISNDGGKTFGNEIFRGAGKIGEFGKRVKWERMGSGRRRVFEVSVSDPIPWRLTNAYLQLGQAVQGTQQGAA